MRCWSHLSWASWRRSRYPTLWWKFETLLTPNNVYKAVPIPNRMYWITEDVKDKLRARPNGWSDDISPTHNTTQFQIAWYHLRWSGILEWVHTLHHCWHNETIVASARNQSSTNFLVMQQLPPRPDITIKVIVILQFSRCSCLRWQLNQPGVNVFRIPVVCEHPRIRCLTTTEKDLFAFHNHRRWLPLRHPNQHLTSTLIHPYITPVDRWSCAATSLVSMSSEYQ